MKNFFNTLNQKVKAFKGKLKPVKEKINRSFDRIKNPIAKIENTKVGKKVIGFLRLPFVSYFLLACLLNLFLETLSRHSLIKAVVFIFHSPFVYLYNVSIIFVTLSLVLFAKRKIFATIFVCAVWIASAFANFIVLCFRTTPFSAVDILMIRNVMTMLDKYLTKWQMLLSGVGIVLVICLLVYLYVHLPKSKSKRRPFRASAYVCMSLFFIYTLTKVAVETQTVSDNFGNLAYAYNDYGFAYCFSNSIIDVGISKPKDYSKEAIEEIVKDLDYDKSEVILVTREEYEEQLNADEENAGQTNEPLTTQQITTEQDSQTWESDQVPRREEEDFEDGEDTDVIDQTGGETATTEYTNPAAVNVADGIPGEGNIASEDETVSEGNTLEQDDFSEEKKDDSVEQEMKFFVNEKATEEYPNIIVIQLESVFDVKYMKDFYPSEDPMPTFTWIKNNFSSGLFTVPAVGAGTANTEFEVQTGISTQFFGAGEYPFKTIMKSVTCDSMGYDLKRVGYATAGFHNNDATFYERYVDYSNLGFDSFTAMEHMYHLNYTPRGWAKDDVLDDVMIERMKATEGRDYITTITVQGHGRYPKQYTHTLTDLTCEFGGKYKDDEEKRVAWTYYINMIRETDNMLHSLLYEIEKMGEPTVVFMYGDHLPSLNLEETDLDGITLYETEWAMWDNIGLTKKDQNIISYHASTYLFERLGIDGGLMQQFHKKYMNSDNQEAYMGMFEMLAYDTLYGEDYAFDGYNPFPQTKMKLGLRDIMVNEFQIQGDYLYILGENFNEFSVVYIDGKAIKTKYINASKLRVKLEDVNNGSVLYVAQEGDDHVVLSVTDSVDVNLDEIIVIPEITTEELTQEVEEE
ncbi:MAG: sulfatase-like hydrolase/transferase [Lachnospiraceae bacterium]